MTSACARVYRSLGAFIDGELTGADRLEVAQHLASCPSCSAEHEVLRDLGDLLRDGAKVAPTAGELTGLASGVISRLRAEDAQSWRAMIERAVEDWHWAFVGAGSLTAACLSILVVSSLFWLDPTHQRDDSLAAMLSNLHTPAGTILIMATPVGPDQNPVLMQYDNGDEAETDGPAVVPTGFAGPSESETLAELSDAVVSPDGRMRDMRSMSKSDRKHTEDLFEHLQRLRTVPASSWSNRRVSVSKVGFVTNTSVSGKAL